MSWAFLADLNITVPTQAWTRLQARRPRDISLAKGWSGLEDASLESAFGRPHTGNETFAQVLAWKWGNDSIVVNEPEGDRTRIRVCVVLDKSLLDHAFPLAALLEAARTEGGTGSLRLVNDGTSGAEDGSEMALAGGKIKATRLDDFREHIEALAGEIFNHQALKSGKPRINPFTGEAIVAKPGINPFTGKPLKGQTDDTKAEKAPATRAPANKTAKKALAKKTAKKPPTRKPR